MIFSLSSLLAQNHVRLQVRLNPGGSFLPACRGVLQNPRGECWGVIREAEVTARGGGLAFGFRTAYVLGQTNLKKPQSETEKHSDSHESEAHHLVLPVRNAPPCT